MSAHVRGFSPSSSAFLLTLTAAGFEEVDTSHSYIDARVDQWYEFLSCITRGFLDGSGCFKSMIQPSSQRKICLKRLDVEGDADVVQRRGNLSNCLTYMTLGMDHDAGIIAMMVVSC